MLCLAFCCLGWGEKGRAIAPPLPPNDPLPYGAAMPPIRQPILGTMPNPTPESVIVTAAQMQAIEARLFAAGMPVAALMEKVAGRITQQVIQRYPDPTTKFGLVVGPGHNGGDALVVARELHFRGYPVVIQSAFDRPKELTASHAAYVRSLGVPFYPTLEGLADCDVVIDGLFGMGLTRSLTDDLASLVQTLNQWSQPILSIDLPSGLHTDTGAVLGMAVQASHTFCLGLWKRAFFHDAALAYLGTSERIDFDIPTTDIEAVLGTSTAGRDLQITSAAAVAALPLPRPADTYKYQQGHLLLLAGSRTYPGAAILAAQAARASGVGMLSVGVPQSLVSLVVAQVPDALVIGLPETKEGAIAHLPDDLDLTRYTVIAAGPGLTPAPIRVIAALLRSDRPLVLDADGLNILAQVPEVDLRGRSAPTLLTPHPGEFRRLFPHLTGTDRLDQARSAAHSSGAIILLKGARVAIAHPTSGTVWVNPRSTPALARGGSGDILTGMLGGLLSQGTLRQISPESIAQAAVWWHAQAGLKAAQDRTELGVDATTLTQYLLPTLSWMLS